ncbi:competence protein ComK [Cytobacillus oceanisediminis]|uniref:competence protein ComK n=1 Tax=Cytobacillus TaxID=2675230 RepID=UPI0020425E63|nr:competence protein ComK [Cytobacillus oceanisediminis]MCM3243106.1 competence protein ComK [Cytobacillus oceanisediminis]
MNALLIKKYIIIPETKSIRAHFNEIGECCSLVLEGNYTFMVKMKPTEIIDESINYYGFDLNGASSGSKTILGPCRAAPGRIPGGMDMYWFPHTSPGHDECVWFALHHIDAIMPEGHDTSNVYVSGGHCFRLNAAEKEVSMRYDRTEKLASKISKRKENTFSFVMERTTDTYSVQKGKRNYIIERKKE